jgi:hypothetical protein
MVSSQSCNCWVVCYSWHVHRRGTIEEQRHIRTCSQSKSIFVRTRMLTKTILCSALCVLLANGFITRVPMSSRSRSLTTMTAFSNKISSVLVSAALLLGGATNSMADDVTIPTVPLLTKKSVNLQAYSDVGRGFKLLRPFGFNEFDGAGAGYAVKFASLFDVDENVVVGSVPATAGKTTVTEYGSLDEIGEKLAKKRGGKLIKSTSRVTDGITFYQFEFENPLDLTLPRTGAKNNRPTVGIELFELCVHKGRLWSVQATSNDKAFPPHEQVFRDTLASFIPRL